MRRALLLLSLLPLALASVCGRKCRFRLCNATSREVQPIGRRILLQPTSVASFGPIICSETEDIRYILSTGEATVTTSTGRELPISEFGPKALQNAFGEDYFTTQRVPAIDGSVITRTESKFDQEQVLNGRCIKLPILSYEKRTRKGVEKVETAGKSSDCVSFTGRGVLLLVELSWEGGDDLDLAVIDPDGQLLSRFNKRTLNGGVFGQDANDDMCNNAVGRERAIWDFEAKSLVRRGKYTVQLRHFENCKKGATSYTVRVSASGKEEKIVTGRSNKDDDELIEEFTFTY